MPVIHTQLLIAAPRERVFDLARSIAAHQASTGDTDERAVAGVTSGLIGLNEQVTWEARHLGVRQRLTSKITQLTRPDHFRDEMLAGAFKHLCHDHTFEVREGKTLMTDRFEFSTPFGPLGRLAESLFLTAYMRRFLEQRNRILQRMAESDEWRKYLPHL
jgi:ligand-binding SRPBCC domain-containing protein